MHTFSTLGAAAALFALATLPAAATVTKTWVSSTGTDSGTCQLVAPCKTFQFAHDQTSPGGEIDVKDTGSYGGLTITKAISVVSGDGALAAVGASSGQAAITVNAGSSDIVSLEGLVIDGHGIGAYGVDVLGGGSLTVKNCKIRNAYVFDISIRANLNYFHVIETEVSGAENSGIWVNPASSTKGSISDVTVHDNNIGILVSNAIVSIINSKVDGNKYGIYSVTGGNVLLGGSTVIGNQMYGIVNNQALINSYGDNYIDANATNVSGSFGSVVRR